MPIKQQGGIFGRNPTFNNVDVEGTLTVNGEPISDFGTMAQQDADSVAITGGTATGLTNLTSDAITSDNNGLIEVKKYFTNGETGTIQDGLFLSAIEKNNANLSGGEGNGLVWKIPGNTNTSYRGARVTGVKYSPGDTSNQTYLLFEVNTNADQTETLTEAMRLDQSLNAVMAGNVVMANGQGIDFSATAGTGTSELFDDYEEGLHNVALTAGTSGSVTVDPTYNTIAYTKVGRVVHIQGRVAVTSVSSPNGYLGISLPFSIASLTQGSGLSAIGLWVTGAVSETVTEFVSFTQPGTSVLRVYFDNGLTTGNGANQMQAGVGININGSYLTS